MTTLHCSILLLFSLTHASSAFTIFRSGTPVGIGKSPALKLPRSSHATRSSLGSDIPSRSVRYGHPRGDQRWEAYYDGTTGYGQDTVADESSSNGLRQMGEEGTYGEILPASIRTIINLMDINANDSFFDLGSGTGKVAAQFAYESSCDTCYGIELGDNRFNESMKVLNAMKSNREGSSQKIVFLKGDILDYIDTWKDATILFVNAFCFPDELWQSVQLVIKEKCSHVRYILLFGKQLDKSYAIEKFNAEQYYFCPASWSDDCLVALYTARHK